MSAEMLSRVRAAVAARYAVERELGEGGMATVYLARDLKHDRPVALKVLRPELSAALGAERFYSEIHTTARLTHPNIVPLFDSGQGDGMLYYVMPYVEGETLRTRLTREKTLPVDEAVGIAQAVSDALAYAHARGVVHRDIKPENILLQNGHPLVADFGIARAVGAAGADGLTMTGLLIGTPLYMSPEQASGEAAIDGRSDVYSLACVLFEMLTGEAPFAGPTAQAVIAKRLTAPAPSAVEKRSDLPRPVDEALQRALARDRGERVASATKFTEMLAAAMLAAQTVASSPRGGARSGAGSGGEKPCIAVLPFANMSADQEAEFFSDGMSEEILNALAKLSGLRVVARTSSFSFKGKNVDVRDIGRALGAGHVLEGSVRKAGNRLRITAQLIDATSGYHIWSDRFDRDMADVFAVQDEVTGAIRDELSKHLHGIGDHRAQGTPSIDPPTYELFLRGRSLVSHRVEGMRQGMAILERIAERAPGFAPGLAALGMAHAMLGWYCVSPPSVAFPAAHRLAQQALALDPDLGLAHAVAGYADLYYFWDWGGAYAHCTRAIEGNPNDPDSMSLLCKYLASVGRHDEAQAAARQAIAADPLNPSSHSNLAIVSYLGRRCSDALAAADRALEIAPGYSEGHRWKGLAYQVLGCPEEAVAAFEQAVRLSNRQGWSLVNLACIHFSTGHQAAGDAVLAELRERARTAFVPPYAFTLIEVHRQPPDPDRVFALLEQAIAGRDFWPVMARVEPVIPDWVRHDPRFEVACRRIGIPPLAS